MAVHGFALAAAPLARPRAHCRAQRARVACCCGARQSQPPAACVPGGGRRDALALVLAGAAGLLVAGAPPRARAESDSLPEQLEKEVLAVEEVLGVQTLLLGMVAASALRVGGAITKDKEKERATEDGSAAAPATLSYTATGARRTAVDITPRSNLLMQQLLADKVNPELPVSSVMARSVLKARVSDPVSSVLPYFSTVTGIAVVADDAPDAVVGVFSRRDAAKAKESDPVSQWMTTPALTIEEGTKVVECAALMLKYEVHRLAVVNARGSLVGIVTRTDVFNALLSKYKDGEEECQIPAGSDE